MKEYVHDVRPPPNRRRPSSGRIVLIAVTSVSAVVILCVFAILSFSDSLLQRFVVPGIMKGFSDLYPSTSLRISSLRYHILDNRIECDSLTIRRDDGSLIARSGPLSLGGVHVMALLWRGTPAASDVAQAELSMHHLELRYPGSQYELRCAVLSMSAPDSVIVLDTMEVYPLNGEEELFAGSPFRQSRYRILVPRMTLAGVGCLDLVQQSRYGARAVTIEDAFFDILMNKYNPSKPDSVSPRMPVEWLMSVKEILKIDTVRIRNGTVVYSERHTVGGTPARVTFDSIQAVAQGIANRADSSAVVLLHAQAAFLNAGRLNVRMTIPLATPQLSFTYSGSLGRIDIAAINPFLEVSDQMRVKSGFLDEATFDVDVDAGSARGRIRSVYTDLTLAAIDEGTGDEGGLSNGFMTFIANAFIVRGSNVPDANGALKIGTVTYVRVHDDTFIQFVWYALRTGVQDVVGM